MWCSPMPLTTDVADNIPNVSSRPNATLPPVTCRKSADNNYEGLQSIDHIFKALEKSPFRRRFHLQARERVYLRQKTLPSVIDHARNFVVRRLAPADPPNDGRQTPFRGHPVFVAQHATATCCRSCLAKWHGIPGGRALADEEIDHILKVLERWLLHQGD